VTNKVSQNLHAELLLRLLGKEFGKDGSLAQGARVGRQFLVDAGVSDQDFFFYDGSGMSMDDRIAPRANTQLLTYAARQTWGAEFKKYAAGGRSGRYADESIQEFAAERQVVGEDGNAERDGCAVWVSDFGERTVAGVFRDGERGSARQQCGGCRGGTDLRGDCGYGMIGRFPGLRIETWGTQICAD